MPTFERLCQPLDDVGMLGRDVVLIERITASLEQLELGLVCRTYRMVDQLPFAVIDGERLPTLVPLVLRVRLIIRSPHRLLLGDCRPAFPWVGAGEGLDPEQRHQTLALHGLRPG